MYKKTQSYCYEGMGGHVDHTDTDAYEWMGIHYGSVTYLLLFVDGLELVLVGVFPRLPGTLCGSQGLPGIRTLWRLRVRRLERATNNTEMRIWGG